MTQASPGHAGAWRRLFLVLTTSLLLLSTACTSNAPDLSPPMPLITSVAIESKGPTHELKARFGIAPKDRIAQKSLAAGTDAGMAAGAGVALACGPGFFICAMATVPAGALVGATTGGLAGAASDAHKMPPDDQLLALDKLFADIYRQHTLHMEIRDSLEQQIPPDRLADASVSDAVVQLSLSDIRFTRTLSGKYEWTLKSVMVVTWNRHVTRTRHSYKIYDYASRALPLDDLMKNDGELLNTALDESVEGLTKQMADDIRFRN